MGPFWFHFRGLGEPSGLQVEGLGGQFGVQVGGLGGHFGSKLGSWRSCWGSWGAVWANLAPRGPKSQKGLLTWTDEPLAGERFGAPKSTKIQHKSKNEVFKI